MNKKISMALIMMMVSVIFFAGCQGRSVEPDSVSSPINVDNSATHYGGAILKEPAREVVEDVYSVSPIEKLEGYQNFDRQVIVYGLTLVIHKDISDEFVNKITSTMVSMFPKLEGENSKLQEKVLQNMYRYKAALPIVKNEKSIQGEDLKKVMNNYSACDIIMKTDDYQANEVVEHLLHAITDVGLSYAYHNEWGFGNHAKIKVLMDEAITDKYYDISEFKGYSEDNKHRVLIQEYAYWAISSYWNLQETYGVGDSEWKLNNKTTLADGQPDMIKLIESTVDKIMIAPSEELLKSF